MASEEFLDHESKDVKLLVACILADVFRIFAPEHPFGNTEKLKVSWLNTRMKKEVSVQHVSACYFLCPRKLLGFS